jgi:hypothetical protein
MRIFTRKILLLALAGSVMAEAACFSMMGFSSSRGLIFQLCQGFHRPAGAVTYFVIPNLEDEATIPQQLSADVAALIFFAVAVLQWFVIFLVSYSLYRCFAKKA